MSGFYFATCERPRALRFLQDLYPSSTVEDSGATSTLLDLVGADIVRVQDPAMHSPAQIVPGTNWDESRRNEITAIASAFHEAAMVNGAAK